MEKGMTIDRVIHILLARINERHGRLWRIRALFDQNEMLSVDWPRDDWDEVMELTDVAFSDGVVTQTDRKAAVRRLGRDEIHATDPSSGSITDDHTELGSLSR